MARRPAEGARDRILDTAAHLFYEQGVRAVGMQQIIDECNCGKSLLYREFPSKDDLVVAWLERCRRDWDRLITGVAEQRHDDPADQLVGIVHAVADDVSVPGYRGCAIRNTYAEFPDPDHPAHEVAVDHVRRMRAHMRNLAQQAGAADADRLADRLMLIVEGLQTIGSVLRGDTAAAAVGLAQELVDGARAAQSTPH